MAQLSDEISEGFRGIEQQWSSLNAKTESKASKMKPYYSSARIYNTEFENKKNSDMNDIKRDLYSHQDLASRATGLTRNLEIQVQSSENRLERTIKHGKLAVFFFAILCAVIGGLIGAKVPGLGQIVAIVVGAVLGFIACGGLGLVVYFVLKWRAKAKRDKWRSVQSNNKQGMELSRVITDKRSKLSEMHNVLNGIEEDNMRGELNAFQGITY